MRHLVVKFFQAKYSQDKKVVNEFPFKSSLCDGKYTQEVPLQRCSSSNSSCRDPENLWKLSIVVEPGPQLKSTPEFNPFSTVTVCITLFCAHFTNTLFNLAFNQ